MGILHWDGYHTHAYLWLKGMLCAAQDWLGPGLMG
jgi:hypothetical protein